MVVCTPSSVVVTIVKKAVCSPNQSAVSHTAQLSIGRKTQLGRSRQKVWVSTPVKRLNYRNERFVRTERKSRHPHVLWKIRQRQPWNRIAVDHHDVRDIGVLK